MMKSVRSRLTVTFIGLIAVILAVIWGVNKWYLEDFYVTKKVQALNAMYTAIDAQIAENKDNGITIEEAMERDRDANGNITEGNLQRLIRNFSDSANVSVLIIDNSTEDATVYSTSRDTKFLKDRVDRYIFGWAKAKYTILEENEQYKIQKTYDPQREEYVPGKLGLFHGQQHGLHHECAALERRGERPACKPVPALCGNHRSGDRRSGHLPDSATDLKTDLPPVKPL